MWIAYLKEVSLQHYSRFIEMFQSFPFALKVSNYNLLLHALRSQTWKSRRFDMLEFRNIVYITLTKI